MKEAERPVPFLSIKAGLKGAEVLGYYACPLCQVYFRPGDKVQLLVEGIQEDEIRLQLCHDDCSMKWWSGRYAGEPKEEHEKRLGKSEEEPHGD